MDQKDTYDILIELVPGLQRDIQQESANALIIAELTRLHEQLNIKDLAIQYLTNGMTGQ